MDAIIQLFTQSGSVSSLMFLFMTGGLGVLLGKVKIFNIRLGIAGVLFCGLAIAHCGVIIEPDTLQFVRDMGLLLFVYSIGLEIGPRFLTSMKNDGLKLNLLACGIVFLGVCITIGIKFAFNLNPAEAVGILCGAVTNTPGLGAAQQLAGTIPVGEIRPNLISSSYAVAYPFGVIGVIAAMLILRAVFRISPTEEMHKYEKSLVSTDKRIESVRIIVSNVNIIGKTVGYINNTIEGLIVSRIKRNGEIFPATDHVELQKDDVLIGVIEHGIIERANIILGSVSIAGIEPIAGELAMREVLVTKKKICGRTVGDIGIYRRYPANITRIFRGELEILPNINSVVEFGDTIRLVGKKDILDEIMKEFGNSHKQLDKPNVLPIFIGIVIGIIFGAIPIYIPGLSIPAKLGLAGGPLIVAIILGNFGHVGKIDFFVTRSANLMLREIGIILFLASVGLLAGGEFVNSIVSGGWVWLFYGAAITFIPIMIIGVIARLMKMNYLQICGLIAGSMTGPAALEYAGSIAPTGAQSITYATVYPLVMLLRIVTAQIVLLVCI